MKEKILMKLLIIGILVAVFIPIITYGNNTAGAFFSVDKIETEEGETVNMTIDLSKIDYDEFKFSLSSNSNLENISADVAIVKSENSLEISGSKTSIGSDQISLQYVVPTDLEANEITLNAQIEYSGETQIDEETGEMVEIPEAQSVSIAISVYKEEEKTENVSVENTTQEENVVAKSNSEKSENVSENDENEKTAKIKDSKEEQMDEMDEIDEKEMKDMKNSKEKMSDKDEMDEEEESSKKSSKTSSTEKSESTSESVTYNGESNNYLSSLSVDGFELSPSFLKTNNTYFLNVSNETTSVAVNAVAEDSAATVKIYGNTDLAEGKNKVMVSVTAENGDVKVYRIYVTRGGTNE